MTDNHQIYLSSPHLNGREKVYIDEALNTNWVAPLGPNVTHFEYELEYYFNLPDDVRHIALLSSGTAALHLSLKLLGISQGDYVICQSFTFVASVNPVLYMGGIPVFVDSEPETWNMDPEALETAIKLCLSKGKLPKAIIAVHLYGIPYKVDEINAVASKYGIPVIEDAAEALGSKYKGRKCGTLGELSILSFNGNKIITTSGGGALICRTAIEKQKTIFYATQARDPAPHYQHSEIGYNYRLSNICAGIGRAQFETLENYVALRRENHLFYKTIINNCDFVSLHSVEANDDFFSNYWLSCILVQPQGKRDRNFLLKKFQQDNIETRPLWKPLHMQPVFKECIYVGGKVAESLFDKGLCLPSGSNLTKLEKERIKRVILHFIEPTLNK